MYQYPTQPTARPTQLPQAQLRALQQRQNMRPFAGAAGDAIMAYQATMPDYRQDPQAWRRQNSANMQQVPRMFGNSRQTMMQRMPQPSMYPQPPMQQPGQMAPGSSSWDERNGRWAMWRHLMARGRPIKRTPGGGGVAIPGMPIGTPGWMPNVTYGPGYR